MSKGQSDSREDIIKIWVKHKLPITVLNKISYQTLQQLISKKFDCRNRQSKLDRIIFYSSNGKTVADESFDDEWKDVIPDSVEEEALNKACSLFK